ncbi:DUF4124 domain-containing protein [Massilia sp. 9096]|uniref:DUF4124 domain-containing protein n=1 Tax=Massilia sp. 9096 TaxID=1500894 RepID=UPI00055AC50C|nr:DUF4124 domain-containing protein [Massilia sp. 9096]
MAMLKISTVFLAGTLLSAAAHAAQPVYKCRADGKVSYSDRPCADGKGETLAPPAMQGGAGIGAGVSIGEAADVGTGDARALLELEKERTALARDQVALAREQARQSAKAQAAAERERRAQARSGRVEVKQVQHCDQLRLQQKWLQEDLSKAHTPAQQEGLRTKLRRHAESMAVQCPA